MSPDEWEDRPVSGSQQSALDYPSTSGSSRTAASSVHKDKTFQAPLAILFKDPVLPPLLHTPTVYPTHPTDLAPQDTWKAARQASHSFPICLHFRPISIPSLLTCTPAGVPLLFSAPGGTSSSSFHLLFPPRLISPYSPEVTSSTLRYSTTITEMSMRKYS